MKKARLFFLTGLFLAALFTSCASSDSAEKRLTPPRSAGSVRLKDIDRYVSENPARAIHLIGIYERIYGKTETPENENENDDGEKVKNYKTEAVENLRLAQIKAIEEKKWDDAASLARSLSSLGITVENTGMEADFILAGAKQQLTDGNNLGAFLAAVRSHQQKPLGFDDALYFLQHAVEAKQRRTAAYFLAVAEETKAPADQIPSDLRSFALGRDSAAEMIKGVATVVVDRGIRIERGMGIPDRVLGSAFFVDASGLLITNYHVISSEVDPAYEGYSRMYIRMGDAASARIPAKVIGWDKTLDLALIKAEIKAEYVFSVVDRIIPPVGDTVIAIGSPGGLEKTVTSGIVSALGRRFLPIGDVIQIDAAVNHGNSGGPVVDTSGRLVGIVFAGIEQFQGLNFAVPAERLAAALPAMIAGGRAARPWLGFSLGESPQGAEIVYVAPSTPAAEYQIPEGAFIKSINGQELDTAPGAMISSLQDILFPTRPGELVALETTDGVKRVLMSALRPDLPMLEAAKKDSRERLAAPLFGLILAPSLAKTFSPTFLVKKVIRGSSAYEAGFSENDPVTIRGFRIEEKDGYALMEINVKKRRMGYLETTMQLAAMLETPDTL